MRSIYYSFFSTFFHETQFKRAHSLNYYYYQWKKMPIENTHVGLFSKTFNSFPMWNSTFSMITVLLKFCIRFIYALLINYLCINKKKIRTHAHHHYFIVIVAIFAAVAIRWIYNSQYVYCISMLNFRISMKKASVRLSELLRYEFNLFANFSSSHQSKTELKLYT